MSNGSSSMDSSELLIWVLVAIAVAVFLLPNLIWPGFYTNIWTKYKLFELQNAYAVLQFLAPSFIVDKFAFYIDRLSVFQHTDITWRHIMQIERFTLFVYGW